MFQKDEKKGIYTKSRKVSMNRYNYSFNIYFGRYIPHCCVKKS